MGPLTMVFLLLTGVFFPYVVLRAARRVVSAPAQPTNFRRYVLAALLSQLVMTIPALGAAYEQRLDLFPPPAFSLKASLLAAAMGVFMLATMPLRRRLQSPALRERLLKHRPNNWRQLAPWAVVSLAAGFFEELVYRGVLFAVLLALLDGSWWAAALVCSIVFSVVHATQGIVSAAFIFLLSIGLQWVVRESGNLYTAMILHAAYNLLAGVVYVAMHQRLVSQGGRPAGADAVKDGVTPGL